ncbi:hypothetical protein BASA_1000 [Bifidobacterium animalis subsp. animalis]|nr:hypothetical protein BANAN_04525 [Bifidobacterium animalis subsp. animalis ATCC 25527]KFI43588.1 hypothetical protein BASA_1000 [Bifidobacterium animalis subsp. animalis]
MEYASKISSGLSEPTERGLANTDTNATTRAASTP